MNEKELEQAMIEFCDTKDDSSREEFYCTDRRRAEGVLREFTAWLKDRPRKPP